MTAAFPQTAIVILRVQCKDGLLMLWYVDGTLHRDLTILRSWN